LAVLDEEKGLNSDKNKSESNPKSSGLSQPICSPEVKQEERNQDECWVFVACGEAEKESCCEGFVGLELPALYKAFSVGGYGCGGQCQDSEVNHESIVQPEEHHGRA